MVARSGHSGDASAVRPHILGIPHIFRARRGSVSGKPIYWTPATIDFIPKSAIALSRRDACPFRRHGHPRALLSIIGLVAAFALEPVFGAIAFVYALANVAYSLLLKHIVLVDVFVISGGMVLRAVAGATVMQVPISPWLYLCTALAALLLALIKRRNQLATAGEDAASQRPSLRRYTMESLDMLVVITATAALIAYSLYTFTAPNLPANDAMMLTIPFVAFGLFRYIILSGNADVGENPEQLLIGDKPLMAAMLLWLAGAAAILMLFR